MASTADCKALLDQEPVLAGRGQGGWKRVSKRQTDAGVERIFSNKAQDCFVRVLESPEGLRVDQVADHVDGLGGQPRKTPTAKPPDGQVAVNLFALYPPDLSMSDEDLDDAWDSDRQTFRQDFTGKFVYEFNEGAGGEAHEVCFYLGYESGRALYDQHSTVYDLLVPRVLAGHDPESLIISAAEGAHRLALPAGQTAQPTKQDMVARFEMCGIGKCSQRQALRPVWLDPMDPLLAPRPIVHPSMWEGLVAGTALGGREMIVLDWEQRPTSVQQALQAWAAREGWRLARPTPRAAVAPALTERAHHNILVAEKGRVVEQTVAAALLAGTPRVNNSRRAPKP